jgi:hypothetical protein
MVFPSYFLSAMTVAYFLALIHHLDNSAAAALARFRPVMKVDEAAYNRIRYELTTMPARPARIATALGALYAIVSLLIRAVTDVSSDTVPMLPFVFAAEIGYFILIYAVVGVVIYHTFHQLWMVNAIYTRYTRINLFQPGPLYALSTLTALTAIGLAIPTYTWFQFDRIASGTTSPSSIFETLVLSIVIILTFIWPLAGAHNLLDREKQRLQDEVGQRVEATIGALQSRIDAGELADSGALKETLDVLVTAQGTISRLRTWPWRTETVSSVVLTFLLPILIWIVQRVLERVGV